MESRILSITIINTIERNGDKLFSFLPNKKIYIDSTVITIFTTIERINIRQ